MNLYETVEFRIIGNLFQKYRFYVFSLHHFWENASHTLTRYTRDHISQSSFTQDIIMQMPMYP